MPEAEKRKRPAAHRWVIALLCFLMVGLLLYLADGPAGLHGVSLRQYWLVLAYFCGGLFVLFCLIVGGRHRWAYNVTSGFLGILALRAVYSLAQCLWLFALGKSPGNLPFPQNAAFLQFAARVRPFSLQQVVFFSSQLITPAMVGLTVWLFIRFTYTAESRSYFQFEKRVGNDPGEPGKSAKEHEETPTLT